MTTKDILLPDRDDFGISLVHNTRSGTSMRRSLEQLKSDVGEIAWTVRERRRQLGYTQAQLAERVGVGLRFLRELERGKPTLRMDRVEQVLAYFGLKLGVVPRPKGER
jgi:y4mF family transcriptional regulator